MRPPTLVLALWFGLSVAGTASAQTADVADSMVTVPSPPTAAAMLGADRIGFSPEPKMLPATATAESSASADPKVSISGNKRDGQILTAIGAAAILVGAPIVKGDLGWVISAAGLVALGVGIYLWVKNS